MSTKSKPKISDYRGQAYTKTTSWPDVDKLGMQGLGEDITGLLMKRVYDIAGAADIKRNSQDYLHLYVKEDNTVIDEHCGERWEVVAGLTNGGFQQVSFVNSTNALKGGTYVVHDTEQRVEAIPKVVEGENLGAWRSSPTTGRTASSSSSTALLRTS